MDDAGGLCASKKRKVPFGFAQGGLSTALALLASVGMTGFFGRREGVRCGGRGRDLRVFTCRGQKAGSSTALASLRSGRNDRAFLEVNPQKLFFAGYFSRATTNSGAQRRARLISESGNVQMALRAESAY